MHGRCRSTNLCTYCRTLYTVETVEMLTLDAMEWPPTLWAVLTAREHLTRAQCRGHLQDLRRTLQRRWGHIEWFVQVEFQRRGALHLNLLVKGVPIEERDELRTAMVERWCRRVDALPVGQWLDVIDDARGTVGYISKLLAHGLKTEQAPPIGWRGHRTSQTRGYLVRPASEMRLEARRSLRLKRALHRGVPGELLDQELELEDAIEWELYEVARRGELLEPIGAVEVSQSPAALAAEVKRPAVVAGERSSALGAEQIAAGIEDADRLQEQTLAEELGRPRITGPDSGQSLSLGAGHGRMIAPTSDGGGHA